jgi:hypothetical protein
MSNQILSDKTSNTFNISPLIRITLLCLYIALTVPLPFLSNVTAAPIPPHLLWIAIALGAVFIYGLLSQKVVLDRNKIQVTYPNWIPSQIFFKGWSLSWDKIAALKMRTTGQGGLVYYLVTPEKDRAYLLPMRIAGFAKMVEIIEQKTGIDTTDIRPLAQPWMYFILFACTMLLWLVDGWTIWTAMSIPVGN